jgi:hypothetical protein
MSRLHLPRCALLTRSAMRGVCAQPTAPAAAQQATATIQNASQKNQVAADTARNSTVLEAATKQRFVKDNQLATTSLAATSSQPASASSRVSATQALTSVQRSQALAVNRGSTAALRQLGQQPPSRQPRSRTWRSPLHRSRPPWRAWRRPSNETCPPSSPRRPGVVQFGLQQPLPTNTRDAGRFTFYRQRPRT